MSETRRAELTSERIGAQASDDGETRNRCAAVQQHSGYIVSAETASGLLVKRGCPSSKRDER